MDRRPSQTHVEFVLKYTSNLSETLGDFESVYTLSAKYGAPLERAFVLACLRQLVNYVQYIREWFQYHHRIIEEIYLENSVVPCLRTFVELSRGVLQGDQRQFEGHLRLVKVKTKELLKMASELRAEIETHDKAAQALLQGGGTKEGPTPYYTNIRYTNQSPASSSSQLASMSSSSTSSESFDQPSPSARVTSAPSRSPSVSPAHSNGATKSVPSTPGTNGQPDKVPAKTPDKGAQGGAKGMVISPPLPVKIVQKGEVSSPPVNTPRPGPSSKVEVSPPSPAKPSMALLSSGGTVITRPGPNPAITINHPDSDPSHHPSIFSIFPSTKKSNPSRKSLGLPAPDTNTPNNHKQKPHKDKPNSRRLNSILSNPLKEASLNIKITSSKHKRITTRASEEYWDCPHCYTRNVDANLRKCGKCRSVRCPAPERMRCLACSCYSPGSAERCVHCGRSFDGEGMEREKKVCKVCHAELDVEYFEKGDKCIYCHQKIISLPTKQKENSAIIRNRKT